MFVCIKMVLKNTIESKMRYRIKRKADPVFLRADFEDFGSYNQVGVILKKLVEEETLVSIGYGAYARTRKSSITGKSIPELPLKALVTILIKKMGLKVCPTKAEKDYNSGRSTQVPNGRVVGVRGRISRKISFEGQEIYYETVTR